MTYAQYLEEWVSLYQKGDIPSYEIPITKYTYEQRMKKKREANGTK